MLRITMMSFLSRPAAVAALLLTVIPTVPASLRAEQPKLSVLFLGDDGHHRPADMAKIITPVLAKSGIRVDFTEKVEALNSAGLAKYDVVAIYRDSGRLPAQEEAALLDFVEKGKGL